MLWFIGRFEQILVLRVCERNRFLKMRLTVRQDWEKLLASYRKQEISLLKK